LPVEGDFPYIRGADDATEAKWFSIADIFRMQERMFEDHFSIIQYFTMGSKK
jgi:bifunctional NMN adenylyltransferase/nudix hydrolase